MRSVVTIVTATFLLLPSGVLAGGPAPSATATAKPAGWATLLTAPTLREPTGIAIDRRGNPKAAKWAYTYDAATGRIVRFGTYGKVLGSWPYGSAVGRTSAALAVGGSGNVFVADPSAGTVSKYSPNGKPLARWNGFSNPSAITVAPNGYIYVAETGAHRLTELSPTGTVLMRWDTHAGFPQQFTVPHVNSGSLGTPIALAWQKPDSLYVGTRCQISVTCNYYNGLRTKPYLVDALLNFRVTGSVRGYLGNWWFGLGHAANSSPEEVPAKETEPFVTIDALAADPSSRAYLAGIIWQLGGTPQRAVVGYTSLGYKWGYWPLPSQAVVSGIATDGNVERPGAPPPSPALCRPTWPWSRARTELPWPDGTVPARKEMDRRSEPATREVQQPIMDVCGPSRCESDPALSAC